MLVINRDYLMQGAKGEHVSCLVYLNVHDNERAQG